MIYRGELFEVYVYDDTGTAYPVQVPYDVAAELVQLDYSPGGVLLGTAILEGDSLPEGLFHIEVMGAAP